MEDEARLRMHPSVRKVAEFMRRELRPEELVTVAQALATAAPAIWPATPAGWEITTPMEFDIHLLPAAQNGPLVSAISR
jgi:hypothetical protein